MRKFKNSIYWIIGLGCTLFLLSLLIAPGSLNQYSNTKISFSYPHSWQLTEWPKYSEASSLVAKDALKEPFKPFSDNENLIKFSIPAHWLVQQESFSGSEIIKHIQITSPDKQSLCLVQIWQQYKPLKEFISDIKNAPISGDKIKDFKVSNTTVKGQSGYLITYTHNNIICKEVYLTYQNQIYRIAYLYAGPKWTKEQESNFQTILKSIELVN